MKHQADTRTHELPGLDARPSMCIGYARVSTVEQDTRLQLDALRAAGVVKIFQEKRSGGPSTVRVQLARMLDQLRPGDVVTVYKLDRLGRSLSDLLTILARVKAAGARFRSLTESIDTSTAAGEMVMHMLGAMAQFERSLIAERSIAGMRAAIERGVRVGRPAALTAAEGAKAAERYRSGAASLTGLARLYGCHLSSVKRAIARAEKGPPKRA